MGAMGANPLPTAAQDPNGGAPVGRQDAQKTGLARFMTAAARGALQRAPWPVDISMRLSTQPLHENVLRTAG
jgi:hypothetical protein